MPATLAPRRRPPLVEEIADELTQRIRAGQPAPGRALPPERELAAGLGISRPVLREALRLLQSRGLVQIQHGVGVLAADQLHRPVCDALQLLMPEGKRRLLQLAQARLLIEPHVAAQAAASCSAKLGRLLQANQRALRQADNPEAAIRFDLEFHRLLAQAADNAPLLLMLEALADLGRQSRLLTLSQFGVERAWRQHEAVRQAVARRDADAARACMQQHIEAAANDISRSSSLETAP